jgi:lipopolysaccharide/colanic/teichoic acid biosynthesis glycosyltransferase
VTGSAGSAVPARPYRGKRAFDLVVLAVVAVPAALVALPCALAVWLTSPGPVLFRQERIGRDGRPFAMVKFRTMVAGDNPIIPDATRITAVGRLLRRTSLDELPNLVNVARGEMSIVGPRPTLAYQVERYDPRQRGRLAVRPGLTGLAQIRGRNALPWSVRIDHDLEYVATQSPRLDLHILAATFGVMARGDGVEGHAADDPLSAGVHQVDDPLSAGAHEVDDPLSAGVHQVDDPLSAGVEPVGDPASAAGEPVDDPPEADPR